VAFPPAVTYDLPPDVLTMVLPATGPETRWRQGLDTFEQVITRQAAAVCLAPRGVAPPDGPPPMFVRFRDVPDLPYLQAHGFDAPTPPPSAVAPPSAGSSPAGSPGTVIGPPADADAALRVCRALGAAKIEPLRALTAALNAAWLAGLPAIGTDPGVRDAYRALPACLHEDEEAFFGLLDAAAGTGRARELAAAYATCMAPIEAVREPLRARLRDRIAAAHPAEVARLRASLPARIRDLEEQTRVRLCFPTA
jgi:hypothetical protein